MTRNIKINIKPRALVIKTRPPRFVEVISVRGADTVELYTGAFEGEATEAEASVVIVEVEDIAVVQRAAANRNASGLLLTNKVSSD